MSTVTPPDPGQTLFLWGLLAAGGEAWLKDLRPELGRRRRPLLEAGLIEEERRSGPKGGQRLWISLTDRGWYWLGNNMDAPLPPRAGVTAVQVLQKLLRNLGPFLERHNLALADIFADHGGPVPAGQDLAQRVREQAFALAKGKSRVLVRLADLRRALPDVDRETLDQELVRLQRDGRLVLYHMDDPSERTPADDDAALIIAGHRRHLLVWTD